MKYRRYFRLDADGTADTQRELDEEIEAHIAMRAEEFEQRGESPARARALARERFGNRDNVYESLTRREQTRRRADFFDDLRADVTLVWRQMRRSPLGALLTVLTFAIGIGLTTAVYAVVDHVLLRPLPYAAPARLVMLMSHDSADGIFPAMSATNWRDFDTRNRTLAATGLYRSGQSAVQGTDGAVGVQTAFVTPHFFDALGAHIRKGRGFTEDDVASGSVVVTQSVFEDMAGGDLSRGLHIDGVEHRITGVIPDEEAYPAGTKMWIATMPLFMTDGTRNNINFEAIGRLKPGVSLASASGDLNRIALEIHRAVPASIYTYGASAETLQSHLTSDVTTYLAVLMGAVLCVLLIACANLAGINFARAASRGQDIAVRMALGAGRGRIIRQLLTEQIILALLGGVIGTFLAAASASWVSHYAETILPRANGVNIDERNIAFAFVVTLVSAIAAAFAPTWRAANAAPRRLIGARGVAHGGRGLPGAAIVTCEVAAAVVLLSGGALLMRSFHALVSRDLGFNPSGLVVAGVSLSPARYRDSTSVNAFWTRALPEVARNSDAHIVARGNWIPPEGGGRTFLEAEGVNRPNDGALYHAVTPNYFDAMQIRVVQGRTFSPSRDIPRAVLINQTLARELWPGQSALGHRIRASSMEGFNGSAHPADWLTVIGVVADTRPHGYDTDPTQEMYVNDADVPFYQRFTHIIIRTTPGAEEKVESDMTRRVHSIDFGLAPSISSMPSQLAERTSQRRIVMFVIVLFAAISLTLAAIGIYALLSFAVAQRTREIGVRTALGASRYRIIRDVVRNAVAMSLLGAAVGMIAAYWLSRVAKSLLVDVTPGDVWSYALAGSVLLVVTVAAAGIPAMRAARVDPLAALRMD